VNGLTRPPLFKEHDIAHQRMMGKKFFALFSDLGTAKTYMLLREFLALWFADLVDGILVIAPVNVHCQWIEEELPATTDTQCVTAAWPARPPILPTSRPRIFTIYPEAFRRKPEPPAREKGEGIGAYRARCKAWRAKRVDVHALMQEYLRSGRIGLIIDESQMIMTAGSKTTRRIKALKQLAAYRRIGSGFPDPKGLIDLYSQYSMLNTRILECETRQQFVDRYCVMGGFKDRQIVGYKNEEDFYARVAPYTYSFDLNNCHPLPGRNWKAMPGQSWLTTPVDLTDEQRRLIEQIKKEFRAVLAGNTIVMPMALQRLTRIQQIACGFLPELNELGQATGAIHQIPELRTEALEIMLACMRGKVVIWSRFSYCIDRLTRHFGNQATRYRGGIDMAERRANKDRFMRDPACRFLFAQPRSLGVGANGLTVARQNVFWSNNFDASIRRQAERRTWRIGQSQACIYIDLIARDTYDNQIRRTLINRQNVAQGILNNIAEWRGANDDQTKGRLRKSSVANSPS